MDLLKNVWQTILPTKVYNETMGSLLEVISGNLINKVTVMEDISTTLASGLVDLIKTVDEKSQSLFDSDHSILSIAPNWQKLLHLQFILDASLVDISTSWKNDQISQSFRADDVKSLIRALFQNTERRSKCLSTIV
jgi:protein transport protein DSL1/ZW10